MKVYGVILIACVISCGMLLIFYVLKVAFIQIFTNDKGINSTLSKDGIVNRWPGGSAILCFDLLRCLIRRCRA